MLKDHVDFDALIKAQQAWMAGTGPKPADIATWRKARAGEICGGCKQPLREGSPVQEAYADGSVGHSTCHVGGGSVMVTRSRVRSRR